MTKINFLIFILSLFLLQCSQKQSFHPEIPSDTLAVILHEIHIYRAYYGKNGNPTPATDSAYTQAIRKVLKKHKISEKTFLETMNNYMEFPDSLRKIYEKALDFTTSELAKIDAEEKKKRLTK